MTFSCVAAIMNDVYNNSRAHMNTQLVKKNRTLMQNRNLENFTRNIWFTPRAAVFADDFLVTMKLGSSKKI